MDESESYKSTGYPINEEEFKFETYSNYLNSIVGFMRTKYPNLETLFENIIFNSTRIQGFPACDMKILDRFLKIAWNTEYLVNVHNISDENLIRITNQWKPIQVYYAVYSCAEAFAYLIDGKKADGHKKCLTKISEFFIKTDFEPWNFAYAGIRGKDGSSHKAFNFRSDIVPAHNLKRSATYDSMIAKCLKAEHCNRVDDDFQKRKGSYKHSFDPGHTTIFHFLYRLRVKSNYKEADIFMAAAPKQKILDFSNNLSFIMQYSLILLEIHIIRKCGKKRFFEQVDEYLSLNENALVLKERVECYRKKI
jgi:hypothetical protein